MDGMYRNVGQFNGMAQVLPARTNPFKTFLTAFCVSWGGTLGAGLFILHRHKAEMNVILGVPLSGIAGVVGGLVLAAFLFRLPSLIGSLADWAKEASAAVIKTVASWVFLIVGIWLLWRFRYEVVALIKAIVDGLTGAIQQSI